MPLDELIAPIDAAADNPGPIPFPLPPDTNPFDPAALSPLKSEVIEALNRRKPERMREKLALMKKDYPDSRAIRWLEYHAERLFLQNDRLPGMAAKLAPPRGAGNCERAVYQLTLGQARALAGDLDGAIEAFKKSIELGPPTNFPPRGMLARALAQKGRFKQAANLYREAHAASPDDIETLQGLEIILSRLGEFEEASEAANKIYRLEHLYRSR